MMASRLETNEVLQRRTTTSVPKYRHCCKMQHHCKMQCPANYVLLNKTTGVARSIPARLGLYPKLTARIIQGLPPKVAENEPLPGRFARTGGTKSGGTISPERETEARTFPPLLENETSFSRFWYVKPHHLRPTILFAPMHLTRHTPGVFLTSRFTLEAL